MNTSDRMTFADMYELLLAGCLIDGANDLSDSQIKFIRDMAMVDYAWMEEEERTSAEWMNAAQSVSLQSYVANHCAACL